MELVDELIPVIGIGILILFNLGMLALLLFPSRFSLRWLLGVMTIAAVALGLAVYALRK
jgi:hypothetical protein